MTPHVHITPIHLAAAVLAVLIVIGTARLVAMSFDNRPARAVRTLIG